jgi:hypothetical protein
MYPIFLKEPYLRKEYDRLNEEEKITLIVLSVFVSIIFLLLFATFSYGTPYLSDYLFKSTENPYFSMLPFAFSVYLFFKIPKYVNEFNERFILGKIEKSESTIFILMKSYFLIYALISNIVLLKLFFELSK